jgi:hypothetical protein
MKYAFASHLLWRRVSMCGSVGLRCAQDQIDVSYPITATAAVNPPKKGVSRVIKAGFSSSIVTQLV